MSKPGETRSAVAALLADGLTKNAVAAQLGIAPSTVAYHARRLGEPGDGRFSRRYDWAAIQAHHDDGHGVIACLTQFGLSRQGWYDAVRRGALVQRSHVQPIDALLTPGRRNRRHLYKRLVEAGMLLEACDLCGLTTWRGAPIVLQLHHRNGRGDDNRLENLQVLCPNCHSQTETWGGRNARRASAVVGVGSAGA